MWNRFRASALNFYRRRIHRHPAATARRVEAERARAARLKRDAEARSKCVSLARMYLTAER